MRGDPKWLHSNLWSAAIVPKTEARGAVNCAFERRDEQGTRSSTLETVWNSWTTLFAGRRSGLFQLSVDGHFRTVADCQFA